MIKELIVVEGKNDAAAVCRAFPGADILITQGWGLTPGQAEALKRAHRSRGVIIFTDPDRAGERIRRRLAALLPGCRHAFIPRERATDKGKIGVEAAAPADIAAALARAHTQGPRLIVFSAEDLRRAGLSGGPLAAVRRKRLGDLLAIGYGNSKNFLWRLNALGIRREEYFQALAEMEAEDSGCNAPPDHN